MRNPEASHCQRIRNQRTVTTPRDGFRTQGSGGASRGQFNEPLHALVGFEALQSLARTPAPGFLTSGMSLC